MKEFAVLFALVTLLSACPMTTPDRPTTPTAKQCPEDVLVPTKLSAPPPPVEAWTGVLPTPPSPNVVWVLSPIDLEEKRWLLSMAEVEKDYIAYNFLLEAQQVGDAISKINAPSVATPRAALAILGVIRPIPQPGPPGEPDLYNQRTLNLGKAVVWSNGLVSNAVSEPGKPSAP